MKVIRKIGQFLECILPLIGMYAVEIFVMYLSATIMTIAWLLQGKNILMYDFLSGDSLLTITAISQAGAAIVAFLVYHFGFKNRKFNKFKDTFSWLTIPALILAFWGISILTSSLLQISYLVFPSIIEAYSEMMEDLGLTDASLFAVLSTVILAPISEELVFRGITLSLARRFTKRFWLANIIQAVLFGVAHGNLVQGLYAFILGMILGYVYKSYNNILVPMICHLLYNIMGGYFVDVVFGNTEELMILRFFVATLVAAIAVYCGITLINKEKNREINITKFELRSAELYNRATKTRKKKSKTQAVEESTINMETVENRIEPVSEILPEGNTVSEEISEKSSEETL